MKNFTKKVNLLAKLSLTCLLVFTFNKSRAQFSGGNVIVLQLSDGASSLSNTGNVAILREFTPGGTPAFSVTVPSTGTNAIIIGGTATSEGGLSLSANNKYLVFGGYAQTLPNSTSLNGATAASINRAIGIVDAAGSYTRAATSTSFHSGGNIRSAASDGTDNFWSAGSNDGTDYFGNTTTAVNVQNAITNTRCVLTYNNDLYFSTGSGTQGIYRIGTGFPLTGGQTNSLIIGVTGNGSGTPSPYGFYFNPSNTICYIADDRTIANGGGIQKWVNSSSTWTLAYTLGTGSSSTAGARGVIADFSGSNPVIYATTSEGTSNRLISIVDAGSSSTATTLATCTTSAIFRGLAFSPCNAPAIPSVTGNSTLCAGETLSLTAGTASNASVTYSWTGNGTFSSPTNSNTTVTGFATGVYTLNVTNSCGSGSSTISVNVLPSPTLSINSSTNTVCEGQPVTLTASGATTYTWSNAIINSASFNPTTSAIYTVSGTSGACNGTSTVAITVNPLPAVNVSSITICTGQSGTLTASGANTYSWSTSSTSSSIVVTPGATTNYAVTGTSSLGCVDSFSTQVVVTNSPAITINSSTICAGSSTILSASGANTYTWSTGAFTSTINVSPIANTVYTVAGGLTGCTAVAFNSVSVIVNPLPVLSVSGSTFVCLGSSLSQTLTGASTYSLNGNTTSSVITQTPAVTTTYSITGESVSGCISTTSTTITVVPLPVLSVAGNTTVCNGAAITQTLSGANTYSVNGNQTSSVFTLTPSASANYTITGTDNNGCAGVINRSITVNALPSLTISSSSPTICTQQTATLSASGASTYSWSNGNSSGSSISISPSVTTTYTVTGTNSTNCSSSSQFVQNVSQCTSVNEIEKSSLQWTLYPNPSKGFIVVDNFNTGKAELTIMNALGATVLNVKNFTAGKAIDISAIPSGVYFVQIYSDNKMQTKKLIVE